MLDNFKKISMVVGLAAMTAASPVLAQDTVTLRFASAFSPMSANNRVSVPAFIKAVEDAGGKVVGICSLVDRSGGQVEFDIPYHALVSLSFPTYADDELPEELAAIPVTKPGSRKA